jgi:hypothetical protein
MSDRQSKEFHTSYHQSCASEYQCRSHLCVSKDVGEAQEENPIDYSDRRQNIVDLEIHELDRNGIYLCLLAGLSFLISVHLVLITILVKH